MRIRIEIPVPNNDEWADFFELAVGQLAPGIELARTHHAGPDLRWEAKGKNPMDFYQLGIVVYQTMTAHQISESDHGQPT